MKFNFAWKTLLLVAAISSALSAQSFSGAIYTSLGDGSTVNQNTYALKSDVYLNGGPQNENAAGLPDGMYYYQVTDPAGKVLLSTDNAECRQLQVVGGVIFGAIGPACKHADGSVNAANGSKPVQLIPFLDTPNGGGEYKVWLIAQNLGTACTPETVTASGAVITFPSRCAKTDNFKVDEEEPPCVGDDCPPPPCEGDDCPPPPTYEISGLKYYDTNANTIRDDGEPPIQGFKFNIFINDDPDVPVLPSSVFSDVDGEFSHGPLLSGDTYQVCEVLPSPNPDGSYWIQTGPVADSQGKQCYSGIISDQNVTGLEFGNLCLKPATGGYTLGFWSNKNGQKAFEAMLPGVLTGLQGLNLRNANGTNFDPTSYAVFRPWLLGGTATNMAYMLSVQMSATWLNVQSGRLSGAQLVLTSNFGIRSIQSLIDEANTELGLHGNTTSGTPDAIYRNYQENLKNELDAINNNQLPFVQGPGTCAVTYNN